MARPVTILGLALFTSVTTTGAPGPDTRTSPAVALVASFNSRALGSPGVRRVRLELRTGSSVKRTFDVIQAWRETRDDIRSVVAIWAPATFAGTAYMLREGARPASELSVLLRLRLAGTRVLTVDFGRFDEGLLGSDFSYVDLRWRIPTMGREFVDGGRAVVDDTPVRVVESRRIPTSVQTNGGGWDTVRYYFAAATPLLVGADYRRLDAPAPAPPGKSLRIYGWNERDGVWSPSRMEMTRPNGQSSVLTLGSIRLRVSRLPDEVFTPAFLPELGRELEAGRVPPPLAQPIP